MKSRQLQVVGKCLERWSTPFLQESCKSELGYTCQSARSQVLTLLGRAEPVGTLCSSATHTASCGWTFYFLGD